MDLREGLWVLCLRGWACTSPSSAPPATWIHEDPDRDFLARAEIGSIPGTASSKAFLSHSCQPPARGLDTAVCWESLGNPWSAEGTPVALFPADGEQAPRSPGTSVLPWWQPQACAELQELPGLPRPGLSGCRCRASSQSPGADGSLPAEHVPWFCELWELLLLQARLQRKQSLSVVRVCPGSERALPGSGAPLLRAGLQLVCGPARQVLL